MPVLDNHPTREPTKSMSGSASSSTAPPRWRRPLRPTDATIPEDGSIPPEDTVGSELAARYAREDAIRVTSTGSDLVTLVNGTRSAASERPLVPGELDHILQHSADLVKFAQDPLGPLPGCFELLDTGDADDITTARPGEKGAFELYVREAKIDASHIEHVLLQWRKEYPADAARLKVFLEATRKRSGPVFVRYFGQTVASTPKGRADVDAAQGDKCFLNHFMSVYSGPWRIYRVKAAKVLVDGYDYRARLDLQACERALISCAWPLCVNSARGGFRHIPDPASLPPALPLPQPRPVAPKAEITGHFADMAITWAALQRGDGAGAVMHPAALAKATQAGQVRVLFPGRSRPLQVRAARDITVESFRELSPHVDYHGRLAGPGPALAVELLLHQNGAQPPATWDGCVNLLGTFVDLWAVDLSHRELALAILYLSRYLCIVRPIFVFAQSHLVSTLFIRNAFGRISLEESADFYAGRSRGVNPETLLPNASSYGTLIENWPSWIGEAVITRIGPGESDFAITTFSIDRGRVKYDPALETVHITLQALVDAANQIRLATALQHPEPSTLGDYKTLLATCESAVTASGIRAQIVEARSRLSKLNRWLGRRRNANVEPGMTAEARSQLSRTIRVNAYERHTKALGDPFSGERWTQFAHFRKEDKEMRECGYPASYQHPLRPRACPTLAGWAFWFASRDKGTDLVLLASVHGTHVTSRLSEDERKAFALERFGESVARTMGDEHATGLSINADAEAGKRPHFTTYTIDPATALLRQASQASFDPFPLQLWYCTACPARMVCTLTPNHVCHRDDRHQEGARGGKRNMGNSETLVLDAKVLFAVEALGYPTYFPPQLTDPLPTLAIPAASILSRLRYGDLSHLDVARLVPDTWDSVGDAVIVVADDPSDEWLAQCAIGALYSQPGKLTGYEEIELNSMALNKMLRAINDLSDGQELLEGGCRNDWCHWRRLVFMRQHKCLRTIGGAPEKVQKVSIYTGRSVSTFPQLPPTIKRRLWAAWIGGDAQKFSTLSLDTFAWGVQQVAHPQIRATAQQTRRALAPDTLSSALSASAHAASTRSSASATVTGLTPAPPTPSITAATSCVAPRSPTPLASSSGAGPSSRPVDTSSAKLSRSRKRSTDGEHEPPGKRPKRSYRSKLLQAAAAQTQGSTTDKDTGKQAAKQKGKGKET